jgi:hypothetical protein
MPQPPFAGWQWRHQAPNGFSTTLISMAGPQHIEHVPQVRPATGGHKARGTSLELIYQSTSRAH